MFFVLPTRYSKKNFLWDSDFIRKKELISINKTHISHNVIKSDIAIFAWRVTWNYAYNPLKQECDKKCPRKVCIF